MTMHLLIAGLSISHVFQPLIDVFEAVLKFFHGLGVPWGWAIILLTICVRACLIPLTIKQIGSMARMQALQPQMKAIQQKYKQDKQRQQQEMMKFYKENNFNPLSSCLPLVAQLPVFIALYYMLRENLRNDICSGVQKAYQQRYALKHHVSLAAAHGQTVACGSAHGAASFLFIGDITSNPTGLTLVVLMLLYVGSQMGSTLVMSAATADPTQRKIMMFLPVIFVLFVIRFPSGLLVYWITTNLWTVGQQYIVRRRIGPLRAAHAASVVGGVKEDGSGGGGSGSPLPPKPGRGGPSPRPEPNGSGGGGLVGLLKRGHEEPEPVGTGGRGGGGAPPRPPRKKKKRSGRRR
ncbi:MAG: YidC/Oxa1 family membrane protein insertase [Solirubrobacteraceae bacterium]